MAAKKLPTSVLVALGLAGLACKTGGDDLTGPCLDFPVETGNQGDSGGDSGASDAVGPCLDMPDGMTSAVPGAILAVEQAATGQIAVGWVLDRGVLPDDVAALLKHRKGD